MASEDEGPPQGTTHCEKKTSGITIDSSLIHTASVCSSDVQSELSGLGVSVYNQQEFEAGVLKQIDTEVQRRHAEQDKKFLLKEHHNVKGEISSVRHELTAISKTIAGLLVQPLSRVGSRLRELRAAQDQKKKHLLTLEVREHAALKRLTAKQPSTSEEATAESNDAPFGFPIMTGAGGGGVAETNEQRLIQTGLLTPFGSSVDTPAELVGECSNSVKTSSCQPETTAESASSRKVPAIKLCSDGFDGLFNGITDTPRKRRIARIPKKKKEDSSKLSQIDTASMQQSESHTTSLEPNMRNASIPVPLEPHTTSLEPNMQNASIPVPLDPHTTSLEPNTGAPSDCEDWTPSLADFLESDSLSSETEYFTDEEMGDTLEGKKRKKKKRLRPLSSDDISEDEASSSRKRTSRKITSDDGDKNLYQERLRNYTTEPSPSDMTFDGGLTIPGSIWQRLYRYQQTGVKWLWELHCQQAGGIVGDEMGLGKTIQLIAFLAGLKISNFRSHVTRKLGLGPVLIITPATVLHQWVQEFHIWWPPFRVAVLHGTGSHGGSKKHLIQEIVEDNGVLITTYSGIRLHQDMLLAHKWDYVVLDEGHKIRNPDAEITLACKQVVTPHRLILSGSPVQNNLRELWSLFDFVFPGKLGTLPVFMEQFSVPITMGGYANATEVQVQTAYKCACILRDTINPYMLRRLKADVEIQLPDKNEQVLFCRLTDYQCELYRDYIQSKRVEMMLARGKEVFSGLMALRKLCSHPDLVTNDYSECRKVEASKDGDAESGGWADAIAVPKRRKKSRRTGEAYEAEPEDEEAYGHWRRSGKMVVVDSLLKLWKKEGHKVLIFSQLKLMLDILEIFVRGRGYTYQRMDGSTPISTRQPLVNKFNQDDSIFVFLLTTRVGGLGINLTGANRIIIYDPDWNPSTDTQARERAWRIGQTRQVTIYRLLTSGTIEEKIFHRQIFKQFLTNRVLKDPRQRRFFKSNSLHELFTLSSSAIEGSTETSAIFAGTNSEIVPRSSKTRSRDSRRTEEGVGKKRKHGDTGDKVKRKSKRKAKKSRDIDSEPPAVEFTEVGSEQPSGSVLIDSEQGAVQGGMESELKSRMEYDYKEPRSSAEHQELAAEEKGAVSPKGKTELRELRGKKKRKKKHKRPAEVEGERIEGVAYSSVFKPGQEDEEQSGKQDDFILQKLFKKSGVHSALQHDTIMNSANPDYVLVESEASKVAKSAARALKDSRRHCRQTGAGRGRATWTGQHGAAGAPSPPRFGIGISPKLKMSLVSQKSFSGASLPEVPSGSLNTSSNILLAQMRHRNTQATSDGRETGMGGAIGIHGDGHCELVKEIRDFVATQGKVNGQATTAELLVKFANGLPRSDGPTFKSMLYEICDFSRHQGDGLWSLKPEFR